MTLISQVLWGALFCAPFGFSFAALRCSTLLLSLAGVCGLYLLVRQLNPSRTIGLAAAFTLGFSPIYFALSHTFMTDVPFTSLAILSLLFFWRSLTLESDTHLLIGLFFAVAATLCRQIGLFLPVAFAVTLLVKQGISRRSLARALIPAVVVSGALIGFNYWLRITHRLPEKYNGDLELMLNFRHPELLIKLSYFTKNVFVIAMYVGLFMLPFLLFTLEFEKAGRRSSLRSKIAVPLFLAFLLLMIKSVGQIMPLTPNVLIKEGIGPITLTDTGILALGHSPVLPAWFWIAITTLSILGAAVLLTRTGSVITGTLADFRNLRHDNRRMAGFFFVTAASIYVMPLLFNRATFDRYLLPVIAIMCAGLAPAARSRESSSRHLRRPAAMLSLVLLAAFSIAATRDYMAWNRKRWEALRYLTDVEHISPSLIDGGFEFNGLYLYADDFHGSGKAWWWVKNDKYMIALGEVNGYEVVRSYGFSRWMPRGEGRIYVLRRR